MKVYLGAPRGFCAGVVRAIDIIEIVLEKYGPPVYVKHQIVHNPYVVASLENKGAITVDNVEDIPEGSTVIFSAHGSPPDDFEKASKRDLLVIDATCPLVTKVHNEAKKYAKEGRELVLIGHSGHQEVKGTMGQAPMSLVDDKDLTKPLHFDRKTPIAVLTQTTLSMDDTRKAIDNIKNLYSDVIVRNDLCYATTNRQEAVKILSRKVDLILVIGAENSSNCNRLKEMASSMGVAAYLVNGPDEMDMAWFQGVENVGITSGASTPDSLVQAVVSTLDPEEVVTIDGEEEDINFVLPRNLR